jgi:hypothetical protein
MVPSKNYRNTTYPIEAGGREEGALRSSLAQRLQMLLFMQSLGGQTE